MCLILSLALVALSDPPTLAEGIRETQITIVVENGNKRTQFQGSVIAKDGTTLTILTAAHGLNAATPKSKIQILQKDKFAVVNLKQSWFNPYYQPQAEVPGADNVIGRIELVDGGTLDPATLKTAEIAPWPIPLPDGQAISVQSLDQFGKEHFVKGGNYTNPRWLEWGPVYQPEHGDSGSGVFVIRKKPDGTTGPTLVGVVVDSTDRGGGASLLHMRDRWVYDATRPVR